MFNQKLFSMKKILLFLLITCLIPAWGYSQYSTTSVEESKAATLQAAQDMQTMEAQDALKMEEVARLKAASSGIWTSRINEAYYANLDDVTCEYPVVLYDSYGDGWNGAYLVFLDAEENIIAELTLESGAIFETTVAVPEGTISLYWISGNWDGECSFEIYYPWNVILYAVPAGSGSSIPDGIFFSWDNVCEAPSCPKPTDFGCTGTTDEEASLSWTENGTASQWQIEYGPAGFEHGDGEMITVSSNPYTLTELISGTAYDAYVRAICDDDMSDWSGVASFQTAVSCGDDFNSVTATIGEGTTGVNYMPMNTYYNYSLVQELYTAEELLDAGAFFGYIHTLSWQYTYATAANDINLQVYMSSVSNTDLVGTGWILDDMNLVFDGVINMDNTGVDYYYDLVLQTPYVYDGASNILITFVYAHNPYFGSQSRFYTHTTDVAMAQRVQRDGSPYDPTDPGVTPSTTTNRNNMRFGMCTTTPDYVTVSGNVTSSYSDNAISGASVIFGSNATTTDENGAYSVSLVQGFSYNVIVSAPGFETYMGTYSAPIEETATLDFYLNEPAIEISVAEIDETAYYMQYSSQVAVTISNPGTAALTWFALCHNSDEKAENTEAYFALGGEDIYTFTLNNPEGATSTGFAASEFLNSMCYMDGVFYYATSTSGLFGIFDPETGAFTDIATGNECGSLGYNPVDGQIYGVALGSLASFYTVDPVSGEETLLVTSETSDYVLGMEVDNAGEIYVIAATSESIARLDKETGDIIPVIPVDFNINYGQDLDYDRETGTMYWAAYNATDYVAVLYMLDTDNGTMEEVGEFSDQASGFAIPTSYEKLWFGVTPRYGNIAAGETATVIVSFDTWFAEEGNFTGYLTVNSNASEEPVNIPVNYTIIPPSCDAPTNLTAVVVENLNILVSWDAPEESTPVAYGVFYAGETVPVAVVSGTSYYDESLTPGEYCYEVRAYYEDGCTSYSPEAVCTSATVLPPQNVVAEDADDNRSVIITWESPYLDEKSDDVMEVIGYEILRNDIVLDIVDADTYIYVDNTPDLGINNYCVKAVYAEAMSDAVCDEIPIPVSILGDANDDGRINVADIQAIATYIVYGIHGDSFYAGNADVNINGMIEVGDIQCIIDILNSEKYQGNEETAAVVYSIENGVLYMSSEAEVSGLQITLSSNDIEVLMEGFTTLCGLNEILDEYVFLAYGNTFKAGTHALLKVNGATVENFIGTDPWGNVINGMEGSILGIEDNTPMSVAYPNPFSTSVKINNNSNAEFVVTSMTGQIVYRIETSGDFEWTPGNVNSGMYFINVYVDGVKVQTSKVVYQK